MGKLSKFIALPKEIRLCIFDQLFEDFENVKIGFPSCSNQQCKPQRYHPAVSQVCHQIRAEALHLLYKSRLVILLLRYREGRKQVAQWIRFVLRQSEICRNVADVSIQYFEQPHRSTSLLINLRTLQVHNRESWLHPLIGRHLKLLGDTEKVVEMAPLTRLESLEGKPLPLLLDVERVLQDSASLQSEEISNDYANLCMLIEDLVHTMLAPLQNSRLLRHESMVNLRLHGCTDFQLRFEVISIIYSAIDA